MIDINKIFKRFTVLTIVTTTLLSLLYMTHLLPQASPLAAAGGEVGLTLTSNLSDPTNETPFVITASAGEPITGFVSGDITVLNGTLDNLENSGLVTDVFTLTVSPTADGLVTVNVPAGAAQGDGSGQPTEAAVWTIVFDSTDPAVTVNQSSGTDDPTNGSAFFTLVFDEPINPTSLTTGDINTAGSTAAGVTVVSVNPIAPFDDTTFEATITATGSGVVMASLAAGVVEDEAGNGNLASTSSDNSVTIDLTPPSVTLNQSTNTPDPTNGSAFFTLVFDEPINPTSLTVADINTAGSTATGITVVSVNPIAPFDDTTFEATVTATGSGVVMASLAAGVVEDEAGNSNLASTSSDNSVTIDLTPPTVTLNQRTGTPDPTNGPAEFTIEFSEPISVATFTADDFSIAGSTAPNITFVSLDQEAPNDGTVFTAVYTATGNGLIQLAVVTEAVEDVVGNSNVAGSSSSDNQVTFDFTNPGVTLSSPITQVTNLADLPVQALFTTAVQGFASGDIVVENGTVENFSQVSGSTYTFTITPEADGVITVTIPAGVATSHGNPNLASNVLTFISDQTPPVITLIPLEPPFIYQNTPYIEPGVVVTDTGGVITDQLQISGTVVITTVGHYTLTYMIMDIAGNAAVPVQRVVEVRPHRLYLPLVTRPPFIVTGLLQVSSPLQGITSYQPNLTLGGVSFNYTPTEMKIWVGDAVPTEWVTYTNPLTFSLDNSHIGQVMTISAQFKVDDVEFTHVFTTQVFYLPNGDFSTASQPTWLEIPASALAHAFTNGTLQLGNPNYGCTNALMGEVRAEFTFIVPEGYVLRVQGAVITADQLPNPAVGIYDAFEIKVNDDFVKRIGNPNTPLNCQTIRTIGFNETVPLDTGSNLIKLENHLRADNFYNTYTNIEAVWVEKVAP